MMKKTFVLLFALLMLTTAALADDGLGVLTTPVPAPTENPAHAPVIAAVMAELPDITIDFICEEMDDGRPEWEVIYRTAGGGLGSCSVKGSSYAVRENRVYENVPANVLTTEEALDVLRAEKGEFTLRELELDYDDGFLCYEGEVLVDGKEYDFEITVEGRIIEWSRD